MTDLAALVLILTVLAVLLHRRRTRTPIVNADGLDALARITTTDRTH